MKKYLIVVLFLFPIFIYAQIGINTDNPLSSVILHIDAKKNTVGSLNTEDDIVITSNGYVGIGTITPNSNLEVDGLIRINDGSQQKGYILVSDKDGIGTWRKSIVNPYLSWRMNGSQEFSGYYQTPIYNSANTSSILTGNSIIGASLSGGELTLPPSTYLISVMGDQFITEYGTVDIVVNGVTVQSFMAINSLSGGSNLYHFSTTSKVEIMFTPMQVNNQNWKNAIPPYTTGYAYQISIIGLKST